MRFAVRFGVVLSCVMVTITGCSYRARPTAMIPDQVAVVHRHAGSVMLNTVGTESWDETLINGDEFAAALERAIVQSGVFATVVRSSQADYRLYVEAKATRSGNVTAHVGGTWRLTNMRSGKVVFDEFITATAHKTIGDALVGMTRVQLAVEAATQAFIRDGLERLSRLELP